MVLNPPQGFNNQWLFRVSLERSGKLPRLGGTGLGQDLAAQDASLQSGKGKMAQG